MTNEVFRDKRLLGALDYIDERFIAEVTESYTFEAPGEYKRDKKTLFRTYRRLAMLAACFVLISAVFPIVHYVLPQIYGSATNPGNAEAEQTIDMSQFADMSERDLIEHVGIVPEEFEVIISQNLFNNAYRTDNTIFKESDEGLLQVYDRYGNAIAEIDIGLAPFRMHALSDGTYMSLYSYTSGTVAPWKGPGSENYEDFEPFDFEYPASATRFNEKGEILFKTEFDVKSDIEYFIEVEDGYIVAGNKRRYLNENNDCYYVFKLDRSGNIIARQTMEGVKNNSLCRVEYLNGELVLYVLTNANSYQKLFLGESLLVEKRENISSVPKDLVSRVVQSISIPSWNIENFLPAFDGGRVTLAVEYDDFILIVSERNTKQFTHSVPLVFSGLYFYTETVYSAYSRDGELIWRTSTDSTDYEKFDEILRKDAEYKAKLAEQTEKNTN